jgi:hypothetical protein
MDKRAGLGPILDEEAQRIAAAGAASTRALESIETARVALRQVRTALKHRKEAVALIDAVDDSLAEAVFHLGPTEPSNVVVYEDELIKK